MVESMTEAGQRDRALGRRKPHFPTPLPPQGPAPAQDPTKVSTCLTLPLAPHQVPSSESSSTTTGPPPHPAHHGKLFPDRHSFPSFERSCLRTLSLSSPQDWVTAGWLAQTCPARSTKSRTGPARPVPFRGLSRHGRCSQPPDRRADLALGCPVWSFLQEAVVQTQETPGPGPPGHLRRLPSALLSCPAKKPSLRKLQTRRHILPSGDSLHYRHTRGDGHTSDLGTAKQCLLYASLRTKGKSRATSSGSAPTWTRGAGAPLRLPATCNALGRQLFASDPSQLCLGLRRSLLWVPMAGGPRGSTVFIPLIFVVFSPTRRRKNPVNITEPSTVHLCSPRCQHGAWHTECLISAS